MSLKGNAAPWLVAAVLLTTASLGACSPAEETEVSWRTIEPWVGELASSTTVPTTTVTETPDPVSSLFPATLEPGAVRPEPTPDAPRPTPTIRTDTEVYVVLPGDSLNEIAIRYGVGVGQILAANSLLNPDVLAVGQILYIPASEPLQAGPSLKLIPDSELVYGPSTLFFDWGQAVPTGSALARYTEEVEGELMSGTAIVELVALRYSVNPRLLLALLEYSGNWLTREQVAPGDDSDPLGLRDPAHEGLFSQISWAADQLNNGFYLWRAGWAGPLLFPDGRIAPIGAGLNAGTVAVQLLFSRLRTWESWQQAISEQGFIETYRQLFGDPFDWAVEPVLPQDLEQPQLQLPFEPGDVWSFTSGPHGAWGSGSAWAALDFAPPGFALGCVISEAWITAAGDGPIVRADTGVVIQDLDGDGEEAVGWAMLYLHVEARDRVQEGTWLRRGDRIGHPSCEGGFSNGTHLHLARKFNGIWIEADRELPFEMDGWVSAGGSLEYDGTLTRGDQALEACSCRADFNQVSR